MVVLTSLSASGEAEVELSVLATAPMLVSNDWVAVTYALNEVFNE